MELGQSPPLGGSRTTCYLACIGLPLAWDTVRHVRFHGACQNCRHPKHLMCTLWKNSVALSRPRLRCTTTAVRNKHPCTGLYFFYCTAAVCALVQCCGLACPMWTWLHGLSSCANRNSLRLAGYL